MKIHFKTIASILITCVLALSAHAIVVLQDSFNYANGGILTVGGPTWVPGYGSANSGAIQITGNQVVIPGSGTSDLPRAYFTNGLVYENLANYTNAGIVYISNSVAALFPSNSPEAALYASFTATIPASSGLGSATYFAYFTDTNFDFRCRVILTNIAATGNYRIGIANTASTTTNFVQTDLVSGNSYTVVMRYVLNSGISTVWINPTTENTTDLAVTATAGGTGQIGGGDGTQAVNTSTCGFGLRNATGLANLTLANLTVGTTFADVVPASAGQNPPFIVLQPQDNNSGIIGDIVTFNSQAGGDEPLGYQWYYISNNVTTGITGATGSNLVVSATDTNVSGFYYATVTNDTATAVSTRHAQLTVYALPVAIVISNQPVNLTVNVGDTATFSVVASGVPPPAYQWFFVTNGVSGAKTNPIAGATFATLTLTNLNTGSAFTNVFCQLTNRLGATNTTLAILTITPVQTINIAQLRTMVDSSFNPTNTTSVFAIQGIVTTWTNLTTAGNSEFCIQDGTAGITVFWSGAPASTNCPPAGTIVKVTGPLAAFSGLLEIEPVFGNALHSVKVVSTNNPLPAPQELPLDPNVTFAQVKAMESSYLVASNVLLAPGTTFSSGVNEPITANASGVYTDPMFGLTFTNQLGQQFTMFINSHTDIPGQPKPYGPVTVYGFLGFFAGTGFEFTPTRYADVVSYIHVTNVLSNLTRPGDAPTNTYLESFLLPGGKLTSQVTISDPAGGNVTLTPLPNGLPASASWSNISNGPTATGAFTFTPVPADSGSNYVVNLGVTSTAGSSFTVPFTVYVPDTNEQEISISEILANPTTNSGAPNFNPLKRLTDTVGVTANDQYVEIVNQSTVDLLSGWTLDSGNLLSLLFNSKAGAGTPIISSNSVVIYSGTGSGQPGLATPNVMSPNGLALPTSTSGLLILRNNNGNIIDRVVYNSGDLNTNGSLKRFPTLDGPLVPEPYVGTNTVSPGLQYDGSAWNSSSQIPTAVSGVQAIKSGNGVVLKFNATASQASTLWSAPSVGGPYKVTFGKAFPNTAGAFTNPITAPQQFYYITTQTNH